MVKKYIIITVLYVTDYIVIEGSLASTFRNFFLSFHRRIF